MTEPTAPPPRRVEPPDRRIRRAWFVFAGAFVLLGRRSSSCACVDGRRPAARLGRRRAARPRRRRRRSAIARRSSPSRPAAAARPSRSPGSCPACRAPCRPTPSSGDRRGARAGDRRRPRRRRPPPAGRPRPGGDPHQHPAGRPGLDHDPADRRPHGPGRSGRRARSTERVPVAVPVAATAELAVAVGAMAGAARPCSAAPTGDRRPLDGRPRRRDVATCAIAAIGCGADSRLTVRRPGRGCRDAARAAREPRRSSRRRADRRPRPAHVRPDPHAGRAADLRARRHRRDRPLAPDRRRLAGHDAADPGRRRVEASAALARAYSHRAAEAQASTDALTGLPNRRYFDEFCGLLARRRRADDAVGVLMVDIDQFKALNDTHGHADRRRGPARGRRRDRAARSARTTSRRGSAARSSWSCCATRSREVALEVGERVRAAVRDLDLRGSASRRCRSRSASPWPQSRTSRSRTSSRPPTGRSIGPSGPVATGSSPPDARASRGR